MTWLFWILIALYAYVIIGYPLVLWLLGLLRKEPPPVAIEDYPSIVVLCPAYNEAAVIEAKIKSFLQLDYPTEKIKMIIISDSSTDDTETIVQPYLQTGRIELVVQRPRQGKQAAHNLVQPYLTADYVVSTDANSLFHAQAIRLLVEQMQAIPHCGLVSGELRLYQESKHGSGESHYWRYESKLKQLEDRAKGIIGACGPLYLIKRELFTTIDECSADDFERTLQVLKQGYNTGYCKKAITREAVTQSNRSELRRKARIISQEWFAIVRNAALLNPFRFPLIMFMLVSHKISRWLIPISTLLLGVSCVAMWNQPFYRCFFIGMVAIILYGSIQLLLEKRHIKLWGSTIPAYFVALHLAAIIASRDVIQNRSKAVWETER